MPLYPTTRLMRCSEVQNAIGLGRSTLYDYVGKGLFPRPRQLGPRAVGWLAEDVFRWIAEREVTKKS